MRLRELIAGSATLLLALPSLAVIKTYTADTDLSTKFPTDRRIYRGDCDKNASTPDKGDPALDQCTCTPGTNCAIGSVPDAECGASEGRPNGGACDPTIPSGPGTCNGVLTDAQRHGSPHPSCNYTSGGSIVINDTGNGSPTLQSMHLDAAWTDFVGGSSVTSIPGTTVELRSSTSIGPAPNQVGTGNTTTTISWGSLTGWTQTGRLFCKTNCPGGCKGASSCTPFGVVEASTGGYGPPAPLEASAFNTGTWTFQGGGNRFTAGNFEVVSLGLGAVTANIIPGGRLVTIPALPLAALGGLGAGLVYLGSRALSRKRD